LKQPRPKKVNPRTPLQNVSDFIDGLKYSFEYAESQHKPVVVNLSWGTVSGPKDGNSLFSQALKTMVGKGKIFVASAANNGDGATHIMKQFTQNDTLFKTYFTYSQYITTPPKGIWLDAWGDSAKTYSLDLAIIDSATKNIISETGFIPGNIDNTYNINLVAQNDTVNITFYAIPNDFNGRPHFYLEIGSQKNHYFSFSAKANEGALHMWNLFRLNNSLVSTDFIKFGDINAQAGDNKFTISDWISGPDVIGVGAYVSKVYVLNENGQSIYFPGGAPYENLATFSSRGPSLNGMIKPDFAAPGAGVVSSINSYDTTYALKGSNSIGVIKRVNYLGEKYPYAMLEGTSMSSPVATGTIALMLEADSTLTPAKILDLIQRNARRDKYTGNNLPDNNWGYGKLNAFITMKDLLGVSDVNDVQEIPITNIYPNPASNYVNINIAGIGSASLVLINPLGQILIDKEINLENFNTIDIHQIPSGMYLIIIKQKDKFLLREKLIISK
ncbi:MAG: S8 family serine peptidase, partial [FCB group bacterium]